MGSNESTPMDIQQIRNDTPACSSSLFLNSAGSSLSPAVVNKAIVDYLAEEEKLGGYKLAEIKERELNGFYHEAAKLVNSTPSNIALTYNATDAYARALSCIPFRKGDVILTTEDDYVSNYFNFITLAKRFQTRFITIKNHGDGGVDMIAFEELVLRHQPRLVSVSHVPTHTGMVQDAASIGAVCEKHNVLYLLDACQSVGQLSVDVKKLKCDFLSATGRKFLRGPRGTGFLYISSSVLARDMAPLFMDLRGADWVSRDKYKISQDAKRFEHWEVPYALMMGLKEALGYVNGIGMDKIDAYNKTLMQRLRGNLSSVRNLQVYDKGARLCNILTFRKKGKTLEETKHALDKAGVLYSVTMRSNAQISFSKYGIEWAIRLSPHYFNTIDEIDQVSEVINSL